MSLRKLLASLLVVSMVLGLVGGSALAAEGDLTAPPELLTRFGIVKGDPSGDYRLNDPITRAEMVTILVRARGDEDKATLLQGAQPFSDVAGNAWYSGYIAYAKNAGIANGYPDGTFKPDAKVTYAEAVAFLVKFLGLQPVADAEWPNNYIQAFENAGLGIEGLNLTEFANAEAIRGRVFQLADNAFRFGGAESAYAKLDGEPPVLTVDQVPATTEATKVTITGKVQGAVKVLVNDAEVAVAEDGSFSAEVDLAVGPNTIVVKAVDDVGLVREVPIEVTRNLTPAAKIEAEAIEVEAGQTVDVNVKVLDQNGAEIPDAVAQITGESELGTFAGGKFTAGQKAGTGTLTLKYGELTATVNVVVKPGPLAKLEVNPSTLYAAPGELVTFTVKGLDAFGNEVGGVTPTFSVEPTTGVLINPSTGEFIASKAGTYTVTATFGEVTGKASVGVYGEVKGIKIEGPTTLVANGKSEAVLTVKLVDENGNVVKVNDKTVSVEYPADIITVSGNKVVDGVATLKVKSVRDIGAGAIADIKVTYDNNKFEATHEIELLEQVASGIVFDEKGSDKYLVANDEYEGKVRFTIVDQVGEKMLSGDWDVEATVGENDPAEVDDVEVDAGTVTVTLRSIKGETGTVTVTATVEGLGSATGTIRAAIARDPYKVEAEVVSDEATVKDSDTNGGKDLSGNKVKFTIVDKAGVPVTGKYVLSVSYDKNNLDVLYDGQFTDKTEFEIDDSKLELTFRSTKAKTFDITVSVKKVEVNGTLKDVADVYKDLANSKATAKVTFVPGEPTTVKFAVDAVSDQDDPTVLFSPEQNKGTLKIELQDRFNNRVPKAGYKVLVKENSGKVLLNGKTKEVELVTGDDGTATVEVEVRPYTNLDGYVLELEYKGEDSNIDAGDPVKLVVLPTLPQSVTVTLRAEIEDEDGNVSYSRFSTVEAGTKIGVEVQFKDRFGDPIVDPILEQHLKLDVDDEVFGPEDENEPGSVDNVWDVDDNVYRLYLKAFKAGRQTVNVKLLNVAGETKTYGRSFTVRAAEPHHVNVAEADDDKVITVKKNSVTEITLQIVDEWGNVTNEAKEVTIEVSDKTVAHIRTAKDGTPVWKVTVRGSKTVYLVTTEEFTGNVELTLNFAGGQSETYTIDRPN